MLINEEDYLAHIGTSRHSGRYPWGSGDNQQFTRNQDFLGYVKEMERQGLKQTEIAEGMGMTTTELRDYKTIANNEVKQAKIVKVQILAAKGISNPQIGKELGIPESTVRTLRKAADDDRTYILNTNAKILKAHADEKTYLDVGSGVENMLDISPNNLRTVLTMLQNDGYSVHQVNHPQMGTGLDTRMKVLVPPGVTQRDVFMNRDKIQQINTYSEDGGRSHLGILPPIAIDPSRVAIRYGPDGGGNADGVTFVRPGVKDISLDKSGYAQVRIQIGDSHYIKGLAMYKDDLPKGVDLLFNTPKSDTGNKLDALKPLKDDPDNQFGSTIKRQITEKDAEGKAHVTSSMNLIYEEGDWFNWKRSISSQVLSKQSTALAKEQLDMNYERRQTELNSIMRLTNPAVKKKLLKEFSDAADSGAIHMQAAALPRMRWHAIVPVTTLSPAEIFAPNFNNGEMVALIRYPHGGTFEIPELRVNNKNPEAKKILGGSEDAVGIHPSVAERLSGADFDGDTVLVIPNNNRKIISTPALEDLKNFNHRELYKGYDGMKVMKNTQTEMGKISNLITDMTIKKASTTELARAVKHSMVVIDAENHELNWKQSYVDNGIKNLKQKYQAKPEGGTGAATLISRAKSPVYVDDRKQRTYPKGGPIDKVTGKLMYEPTNKIDYKKGGLKQKKLDRLATVDDANELSSGTPMEKIYADHSNRLKVMANQARLEMLKIEPMKRTPSAAKLYASEVAKLDAKLTLVISNRPLERQAQIIGGANFRAKLNDNPNMDKATQKKIKFQALEAARLRTKSGLRKTSKIEIEQSEWDAIQAGAISNHKLEQILAKADMDVVRKLAMPRQEIKMTSAKTKRAKTMLASGYTRAEVAEQLGVSVSTLATATGATEDV